MDVPQLTEDEMAEIKKEAIERLRPYLCSKITAERHFDYLRAKKILTKEDTEEISYEPSSRKKTGKFLDYLAENPKGLDTLIVSIRREGTQLFIIERLTDAVQQIKNERLEPKKGSSCSTCSPSTNDLSRTYSDDSNIYDKSKQSTLLYHPEDEFSSPSSSAASLCSMNLPVASTSDKGDTSNVSAVTLPRPGDPGAPPLPMELQSESEGACESPSDSQFLPLRSRSLSPP
ncbi:B-cell lymphoma/leukemia 10 [Latimeria chalumnae]|uniref:B-cell lymphoma/leukemia 10 n=1 Tax=Latimeria chalumnae TaxID=7897 RepID=UPI0003C134A7|nr:PREDICTED: B-cell lymphoma/leukemia 10 [Latimeria chalumnae]|eukprot:XP_005993918.1 PREDICTED: B-cell lymphoma/leukemia 10 [Latimeria chalumnae]